LVPGFFALALMAVGIGLFYGLYRDLDIFWGYIHGGIYINGRKRNV
jgi:hypothetical protein